jgi:hypothetical protein
LLEDQNLKRWYDNVARGSLITANVNLRRLGRFCKDQKVTPQRLLKLSEEELYNLLLDTVSEFEAEEKKWKIYCAPPYSSKILAWTQWKNPH